MFGDSVAAPAATVFVFDQQVFFPTHNVVTDMFLRFTFRLVIHKGMNSKARMYVAHQVMEGRVSAGRVEEFGEGGTGRNRLAVDDGGMDWSEPIFTTKELMIAGYAERHPELPADLEERERVLVEQAGDRAARVVVLGADPGGPGR